MPWQSDARRQRLPKNWQAITERIKRRDGHRCKVRDVYGVRCDGPADQVDHIIPGDDHRESNLRSICEWHHSKKSAREGGQAKAALLKEQAKKFRRVETHPGAL